jgi:hypothetical protein
MKRKLRKLIAFIITPVLVLTGFRFSKHWRWSTTVLHRIVYYIIDTSSANFMADNCIGIKPIDRFYPYTGRNDADCNVDWELFDKHWKGNSK